MSRTTAKQTVAPTPEEIGAQPYLGDDRQQPVIIQQTEPPYIEGGIWLKPIVRTTVFVATMENGYASRSFDGGLTWAPLPRGLGSGAPNTSDIRGLASNGVSTFIASIQPDLVVRSTDKGITWENINVSPLSGFSRQSVYTGTNFISRTELDGIFISNASGDSWFQVVGGGLGSSRGLIITESEGVLIQATQNAVASRSTDGGLTWTVVTRGFVPGTAGSNDIEAIHGGDSFFLVGTRLGHFFRSTDGGLTWTTLPRGLGFDDEETSVTHFASDGLTVIAALDNSAFSRSLDGGITWTTLPFTPSSGSGRGASAFTAFNGIFIAGFLDGSAYRSGDGGDTWTRLPRALNTEGFSTSIYSIVGVQG